MEEKDIKPVGDLLKKYLERFNMAQNFTPDEIDHWLLHQEGRESEKDRVVWAFVVEKDGKITDFSSFYKLESSIIKRATHNHSVIRAAYLYYYATEVAFENDEAKLKARLNELVNDTLVEAKKVSNCTLIH